MLGIKLSSAPEEITMMHPATAQALGQARLAELRHQVEHAGLARAAGRVRRGRRQQTEYPGRGVLAALTGWARRPKPAPESS
jgi:hypothetical protein